MTLVLQESPDCYHLLPADKFDRNNSSFPHLAYEFRLHDPKGMSHGSRHWFHPRPGISLLVDDYYLREDLVIVTSPNQTCNYLELGFSIINHSGSADLTQVAQFVGYTARSAFVRAFSSKFGVSPSDYMLSRKKYNLSRRTFYCDWFVFSPILMESSNVVGNLPQDDRVVISN